ncbi:hypothetical protein BDP27DRAFT_1390629 [Rhodocollybia butyracea]|uniref:3'-5' exonuclease domain-containing protein n=1 Tax=Rhodocollybia butyracea TaxID=206335 RepID=A0A9P5UDR4_9AGAR|nr:hypothetical protein BDP27DRAFT_1390629 [Rhodocollybia butyracea]
MSSSKDKETSKEKQESDEPPLVPFTFVDTPDSFSSAIAVLSALDSESEPLIIDCEGLNLGVDGGHLSLVCIYARENVFLFDIVALEDQVLPLWTLLASPSSTLILYDGRMDFCALYHHYNVDISKSRVLDLQLVDVQSRFMQTRKERETKPGTTLNPAELPNIFRADHLRRLRRCFSWKQVNDPKNASKYTNVHILQGLGSSLVDHGCVDKSPKKSIDHDSWMARPLSPSHLQYAAYDVVLISKLYTHFLSCGYIQSPIPSSLISTSQKYISLWSDLQPSPDDVYRSHPLLPLEILEIDFLAPTKVNTASVTESTIKCSGCARYLSSSSFITPSLRSSTRFCYICTAVPFWKQTLQLRKEQREMRERMKNDEGVRRGVATEAIFGSPGNGNHQSPTSIPSRGGRGNATRGGRGGAPVTVIEAKPEVVLANHWNDHEDGDPQIHSPTSPGRGRGGRGVRGRGIPGFRGGRGRGVPHSLPNSPPLANEDPSTTTLTSVRGSIRGRVQPQPTPPASSPRGRGAPMNAYASFSGIGRGDRGGHLRGNTPVLSPPARGRGRGSGTPPANAQTDGSPAPPAPRGGRGISNPARGRGNMVNTNGPPPQILPRGSNRGRGRGIRGGQLENGDSRAEILSNV